MSIWRDVLKGLVRMTDREMKEIVEHYKNGNISYLELVAQVGSVLAEIVVAIARNEMNK